MPRVLRIYRHIVKGLQTESMLEGTLLTGAGLEWDRAFAFKHTATISSDLQTTHAHSWISKKQLLTQHDFPQLAQLRPRWEAGLQRLSLWRDDQCLAAADCDCLEDRHQLEVAVQRFLVGNPPFAQAYHPTLEHVQLLGSAGTPHPQYTDAKHGPVSVALQASLAHMETQYGHPIDARCFRINLLLQGGTAWDELEWSGRRLIIGPATLQLTKPIGRCPNIDVDPETGRRDHPIFEQMPTRLGHTYFGIRAEVLVGGCIRIGDPWRLSA